MKNIKRLVVGVIGALALFGCEKYHAVFEKNMPQANGYDVVVEYDKGDNKGTTIRVGKLNDKKSFGDGGFIIANDYDGDGRVDNVKLIASKGSPLEELASVKKVSELLLEVKEKGKAIE